MSKFDREFLYKFRVPLYALFAVMSIGVNLLFQQVAFIALQAVTSSALIISLIFGTVGGFIAKYIMDKNLIFFDKSSSSLAEARKIITYAIFGVCTTILFWGTEITFLWIFGTTKAKYFGAVLGLILGYALKFFLDRRFTFSKSK